MFSCDLAVIFTSFWLLHVCIRMSDMTMTFPSVTGSSVHDPVHLPGKSAMFEPLWGFLTYFQLFSS